MEGRIVEKLVHCFEISVHEAIELVRTPEWDDCVGDCEDNLPSILSLVVDIGIKERLKVRAKKPIPGIKFVKEFPVNGKAH